MNYFQEKKKTPPEGIQRGFLLAIRLKMLIFRPLNRDLWHVIVTLFNTSPTSALVPVKLLSRR